MIRRPILWDQSGMLVNHTGYELGTVFCEWNQASVFFLKAVVIQSITPAFEAANAMGLRKRADLSLQVLHDSTDFIYLLPPWKTPRKWALGRYSETTDSSVLCRISGTLPDTSGKANLKKKLCVQSITFRKQKYVNFYRCVMACSFKMILQKLLLLLLIPPYFLPALRISSLCWI